MTINQIKLLAAQSEAAHSLKFGRFFAQGEIFGLPATILDGQVIHPSRQQAVVKNRWLDGSVKFAIISVEIPIIANQEHILTFADFTGDMSSFAAPEMSFSRDASISWSGLSTSISQLINGGHFTMWEEGHVSSSAILADHTGGHDLGSLRPIFHLTIWHRTGQIQIRYIGEIADTGKLQDEVGDLLIIQDGESIRNIPGFLLNGTTRFTEVFWASPEPVDLEYMDHGLDYLISTTAVENLNKEITPSTYSIMPTAATIYGRQQSGWRPTMGTAGGHPQIGLYPRWDAELLRNWSKQAHEFSLKSMDLVGAWNCHFREGDPSRENHGRPIAVNTRPTLLLSNLGYNYTHPQDRITPIGHLTKAMSPTGQAWKYSRAHWPLYGYIPYILTGDPYFLEELEFAASAADATSNGAATTLPYGRGPTGRESVLTGNQIRGQGWVGRIFLHLAFVLPDDHADKKKWQGSALHAIAGWEGAFKDRLTIKSELSRHPDFAPSYEYGYTYKNNFKDSPDKALTPMFEFEGGTPAYIQGGIDPGEAGIAMSSWQQSFVLAMLVRAAQWGFYADQTLGYISQNIAWRENAIGWDPVITTSYVWPLGDLALDYFTTPSEINAAFMAGAPPQNAAGQNVNHGYNNYNLVGVAAADAALKAKLPQLMEQSIGFDLLSDSDKLDVWSRYNDRVEEDGREIWPEWDVEPIDLNNGVIQ